LLPVLSTLAQAEDAQAALHASHPFQEIGNKVIGPASKVSADLGDKVRAALRRPSADLKGTTPPPQYEQAVREAMTTLDGAVERVVPKERRTSLVRARVLADLLLGVASEYEEAYKAGKITQRVEYQDAYAFLRRAQAVHRDLAPSLRAKGPARARELDAQLAALARALPGLTPPASPMSAERMQGA
jgi:hypothetical protein